MFNLEQLTEQELDVIHDILTHGGKYIVNGKSTKDTGETGTGRSAGGGISDEGQQGIFADNGANV